MIMEIKDGRLKLFFVAPHQEYEIGVVKLEYGKIEGAGQKGITYHGYYEKAEDGGFLVAVTAIVPKGTEIVPDLLTEEEAHHELNFHLSPDHVGGQETKAISLKGFGTADVRFVWE
jgi:hypothetical protein